MEFKTLEELSTELGITKRLLQKWSRNGMKCVRQTVMMSTVEWVDEYRVELAERPKSKKQTFEVIKYKPMRSIVDCKVH